MSRLEIIHLRAAGTSFASLADQIREAIRPGADSSGAVTVYRRSGLETDVAVHISRHERDEAGSRSALGLHLAAALSAYGLVEHTVWEELT
jgi:hypothetical protein